MTGRRWRDLRDDRGTFALELAIVAPMLVGLLWMIISAGRLTVTASKVEIAARDGARAASINHNNGSGMGVSQAVDAAVKFSLRQNGVSCVGPPGIELNDPRPDPGDAVQVTVSCNVALLLGSAEHTVRRTSVSVLDTYRGTT